MTDQNNGGPAFPRSESLYPDGTVSDAGELGMTLRDYFAAKAMQGMWASDSQTWHCSGAPDAIAKRAKTAYAMADAMLVAREGGAA